ncbi:MAG: 16S rRNA (cytosine(1402)-N(4))-methyltransferase RsmH [Ignavibacterium sp.]
MQKIHQPVLLKESCDYLITNKSGIYFDGTIGFGGHTKKFLELLNDDAIIIATDVDYDAFLYCKNFFADDKRLKLYNFNFSMIDIMSKIELIDNFDGIFVDLGVSSFQLDNADSGFTYRMDAKLDLRMDKNKTITASDVVNTFSVEDLANIFFEFGEEKNSKRIARKIVEKRKISKINTTTELAKIIEEIVPKNILYKTLSRVFQAIRIYINDELNVLKNFLTKSVDLLKVGGRIVVISYHSLEDRIVKEQFKYEELDCICPKDFPVCKCDKESRLKILTKKPVVPTEDEIKKNFRARSAKLRAAERL